MLRNGTEPIVPVLALSACAEQSPQIPAHEGFVQQARCISVRNTPYLRRNGSSSNGRAASGNNSSTSRKEYQKKALSSIEGNTREYNT